MRPLIFVLLIGSLVSVGAYTSTAITEAQIQTQVKEVAKTLRCAVCQSESVWESNAKLAIQMRDIIREKIIAGESPDAIRDYFVGRYGDFILLSPRALGLNWILWIGPVLFLGVGGILLYHVLKRWTSPVAMPPPVDESDRERIEDAMHSIRR